MKKPKSKPMTPLFEAQLETQAKRIRKAGEAAKVYNSSKGKISESMYTSRNGNSDNQIQLP